MARFQEEDHAPHTCTGFELLEDLNMYAMKKVYENGARKYNDYYRMWIREW